ncbi:hypothetical protein [Acetivibrio clariflavus]|uniref:Uncharacterized protein n=1 Tax=Acetivibrio clariflavus (strain DSM 19732 / NBRC 101661 / EBR45) TaxID=720554 RepID=G8LWB7_ACECE|nr:hypothetical protein [Acetivibrio clariflavus]AEV69764.1 hypothetical protein Clocl_3249 [Acetivibrio clariflavus DSM 19732]
MDRNSILSKILIGIFILSMPVTVYANSSWHWITMSPMKILPYVIIFTLIVEIAAVFTIGKVKNFKRVFYVISLANLFSYLAPYVERAYRFIPTSGFRISAAFNKGPYYIVLTGYLILTIIVELPIVFWMLRKHTESKKMLVISILGANIVTTVAVAIIERILCIGQW